MSVSSQISITAEVTMFRRSESNCQLKMSWVCHASSPVAAVKPTQVRPWFSSRLFSMRSGTLSTGVSISFKYTASTPTPETHAPEEKKWPANALATKWSAKSLAMGHCEVSQGCSFK